MRIGIPKEIKDNENRVGMTPAGVEWLSQVGHQVIIEQNAGVGSGFSDEDYRACHAEICSKAEDVWNSSDMVIKVKEPLPTEFKYFRESLILFAFLHLAADQTLTGALVDHKVVAIGYETIQLPDGSLPLLTPMSEVAGRMSVQIGASYLEKRNGGRGILLGGVPGVPPGEVVIIGGGVVGTNAARIALGMGAKTTIIEKEPGRLRELDDLFQGRVTTLMSNPYNIHSSAVSADLLIGAVLIPGVKAPLLVREETVKQMKPGSVIIDVAIDQGGSIETIDRVTTHSNPIYEKHGVVHYAVANMPGAVPYTSTLALTNATIPYVQQIAGKGYRMIASDPKYIHVAKGFNVLNGYVVHTGVSEATGYSYVDLGQANV